MSESVVLDTRKLGFQWETADPFLFCVHHEDHYPAGEEDFGPPAASLEGRDIGMDFEARDGWRMYHGGRVPGFPEHPHRGFETVTVVQRGLVDHADSMGAAGRYGGGDVQWMTAGKGIQHSEMFPLLNREGDNKLELFQIWLNLPRAGKFAQPHFKMLWRESIPNVAFADERGKETRVLVIAGVLGEARPPAPPPDSWAARPEGALAIWLIDMPAGAAWTLPAAEAGLNRTLYFFQGSGLRMDGKGLAPYHAAGLRSHLPARLESGNAGCRMLLLQGRPIGEPVAQYGPFVMNTQEEIRQAFADYRETRFGGWPWERGDPVHGRGRGRFARHADGTLEERPA